MGIDHLIAMVLAPLTVWMIVSGIDDLFVIMVAACLWLESRFLPHPQDRAPTEEELDRVPQRRMAIFVCLWREHCVIRDMIEHNIRNIRYRNYDFFIGVYPNDTPTVAAASEVAARYPNVHLSVTPHPGGTSKADNLNWIFQRMLLHEERHHVHFDMIVIHDAEDIIHPDDLRWMNYYAQWYDTVQIPVLALRTPVRQFTHGLYCDEFAQFQFTDMPAREALGGFLPSSGVGTGFSRRSLEKVAAVRSNQIFDATSLTEDYEIGFHIHRLGFRQKFVRIQERAGTFIATREYFAQTFRKAVTQRSRWTTGIGLQSWEKHGWRETVSQFYWFFRDRKGLIGSLLTQVANLVFLYGLVTWIVAAIRHTPWGLAADPLAAWVWRIRRFPILLIVPQIVVRILCSAAIYGWKFAAYVPARVLWGNLVNSSAAAKAVWTYANCRLRGIPLRWLKTEHAYPSRDALVTAPRKLGEILIEEGFITAAEFDRALADQPAGTRIGAHLVRTGRLTEDDLYHALGLQQNLPVGKPDRDAIASEVTRTIPADLARGRKILPFRIVAGQLYIATPEIPGEQMINDMKEFWPHEMRFQLVPPSAFEELVESYLPPLPVTSVPGLLTGLGLLASLVALARALMPAPAKEPAGGAAQNR